MKQIAMIVVAALVGIVLGNLRPQSEIDDLRAKLAAAEAAECEEPTFGRDLARLMEGSRQAARAPAPSQEGASRGPELARDLHQAEAEGEELREEMRNDLRDELGDADEMDAARAALDMRSAQARAALFEDAELDDEQVDRFEGAVADMNAELMSLADELVSTIELDGDLTRRDAMAFAADALDTMIVAEDRIVGTLDGDQLDAVDDAALDPFSYVDSDVVNVLERLGE